VLRSDYERVLDKLCEHFPDSILKRPSTRREWLWSQIKLGSAVDFATVIDKLIGWRKVTPSPGVLLESYNNYAQKVVKRKVAVEGLTVKNSSWCIGCGNTGILRARDVKRLNDAFYAFLCTCEVGQNKEEALPPWNKDRYFQRFKVDICPEPKPMTDSDRENILKSIRNSIYNIPAKV